MQQNEGRRPSTKERMVRAKAPASARPHEQGGRASEPDKAADAARAADERASSTRELGLRGENAACDFLKRRGYIVLERNWTCPAGEADIVAKDEDGVLVFVEVKTRSSLEAGLPAESVTPRKRARYERIAGYFLADYDGADCRVRFDVVALLVLNESRALVRHYVNAFGAGC